MHTMDHENLSTPYHHQKDENLLEVENKMEPTIPMPAPNHQFRPPLPETNPNFCKNDNVEKRKTATPKRKFRPATPRVTAMYQPLSQAPPKSSNNIPATIREDTPWPGASKMSGNLFNDRNWLLLKGYLAIEDKKEDTTTPSLKEEPKTKEHSTSPKEEKCGWVLIVPSVRHRIRKEKTNNRGPHQSFKPQNLTARPKQNSSGKLRWRD